MVISPHFAHVICHLTALGLVFRAGGLRLLSFEPETERAGKAANCWPALLGPLI